MLAQREKLLESVRRNPKSVRFPELETLLAQMGWEMARQRGSHRVWISPDGYRLPIQPTKGGMAKPYQVRQFLEALDGSARDDDEI